MIRIIGALTVLVILSLVHEVGDYVDDVTPKFTCEDFRETERTNNVGKTER